MANFSSLLRALLLAGLPLGAALAQTSGGVGIGTTAPAASAALDITSTTQGVLLPRLTLAQRNAMGTGSVAAPVVGLIIYQTDNTPGLYAYTGTDWVLLGADNLGNHTATQNLNLADKLLVGGTAASPGTTGLSVVASGNVGIGTVSPNAPLTVQASSNGATLGFFSSAGTDKYNFSLINGGLSLSESYVASGRLFVQDGGTVGIGTTSPAATAALDISSSTKGFLLPRLTTPQRRAIASPALGLQVYTTDSNQLTLWNGRQWVAVQTSTGQDTTYAATGSAQTYVVPAGITTLKVSALGASGGNGNGGRGGTGARVTAYVSVTPGETLQVNVGVVGADVNGQTFSQVAGGFNGGGSGFPYFAGAGGGATDLRRGTATLTDRLLVAGGGGGGGGSTNGQGGSGGTPTGQAGSGVNAGGGGSATAGGAGGGGGGGDMGSLGAGGGSNRAAGGGGGYYGGGGGGSFIGAGGGGSSYLAPGNQLISYGTGNAFQSGVLSISALSAPTLTDQGIRFADGTTQTTAAVADNLGNHTATRSLNLAGQLLVGGSATTPGTRGLSVNASGNVGIGTTSPTRSLHLATETAADGLLVTSTSRPISLSLDNGSGTADLGLAKAADEYASGAASGDAVLRAGSGHTLLLDAPGNGSVRVNPALVADGNGANNGTFSPTAAGLHFGSGSGEGIASQRTAGAGQYNLDFYTASTKRLSISGGGNVGIGTATPAYQLEVVGAASVSGNSYVGGRLGIGTTTPTLPLTVRATGGGSLLGFAANGATIDKYNFSFTNGGLNLSESNVAGGRLFVQDGTGNVGIGTSSPGAKLDVQGSGDVGTNSFAYFRNYNGRADQGNVTNSTNDVSIRASGPVMAAEFYALSDARLKTVVGRSDNAADLAALTRLRVTDYTMRDRAQFGDRAFKKVIAQEVEQVLPQAVSQRPGFVPDVYAPALAAQVLPGDSLLLLTLPAGLPAGGAAAGQRIRLMGEAQTVLAAVARPATAGTRTLTVRRALALAGQPVFVYGLEHPDVRAVDYEALSMLNVSATQELARQVQALQQRNAALEQRNAALESRAARAEASLGSFEQRLRALEAGGAQAQASK